MTKKTLTLGQMLRRKRTASELTQTDLAEMFGVNQSTVAKWEHGATRIGDDYLEAVAEWLDLSLDKAFKIQQTAGGGNDGPANTVGEMIRRQRKMNGMAQWELAQEFGVDQTTVARWERGDRIADNKLEEVAAWLGVPLSELPHGFRLSRAASNELMEMISVVAQQLSDQIAELTRRVDAIVPPQPAAAPRRAAAGGSSPSARPARPATKTARRTR